LSLQAQAVCSFFCLSHGKWQTRQLINFAFEFIILKIVSGKKRYQILCINSLAVMAKVKSGCLMLLMCLISLRWRFCLLTFGAMCVRVTVQSDYYDR